MYHPDAMLKVAHTRELELIREAEACGIPTRAEAGRRRLSNRMLSNSLACWRFLKEMIVGSLSNPAEGTTRE